MSRAYTSATQLYHTCLEKATAESHSVRISYKNPLLKLCRWENRHEQTVNFSENHAHFLKNIGSKVKGIFHKTAAQTALKLRRASLQ